MEIPIRDGVVFRPVRDSGVWAIYEIQVLKIAKNQNEPILFRDHRFYVETVSAVILSQRKWQ